MKRLLGCLLVMVFLCGGVSYAKDKTVEFTWEKKILEADLAGFKIYEYDEQDNATALVIDIPYVAGQTEFNSTQTIDYPDGQSTVRRYRITAYDLAMNESQKSLPSNDILVDFEPPGGCLNFKVRIISN